VSPFNLSKLEVEVRGEDAKQATNCEGDSGSPPNATAGTQS
jgi:hypothetical protein